MAATATYDTRLDIQISRADKTLIKAAAKRDRQDMSSWIRRIVVREARKAARA